MRRGMAATECTVYQDVLRKLAASWARLWPEGLGLTGNLKCSPRPAEPGRIRRLLKRRGNSPGSWTA
jgi:hypothetical protein